MKDEMAMQWTLIYQLTSRLWVLLQFAPSNLLLEYSATIITDDHANHYLRFHLQVPTNQVTSYLSPPFPITLVSRHVLIPARAATSTQLPMIYWQLPMFLPPPMLNSTHVAHLPYPLTFLCSPLFYPTKTEATCFTFPSFWSYGYITPYFG